MFSGFKSQKGKNLLFCVVTVGLIYIVLGYWNCLVMRDNSRYSYSDFLTSDTEYDVLFFGSSHVYSAVSPMQLWNDHGITSYNLGCSGGSIPVSYWMMKSAFRYHKPKVAVLDVFYAESNVKIEGTKELLHDNFDVFPLSITKIQMAADLYDGDRKSQFELLFPFSAYHGRWSSMDSEMLNRPFAPRRYNCEKGANSYTGVAVPKQISVIEESCLLDVQTMGLDYISKFIDVCIEEDVIPLIINIPYIADECSQRAANSAMNLARDKGADAINLMYEDVVDFNTDMRDSWSHLNPGGEYKVTDFLGKYLSGEYHFEDKRNNAGYSDWKDDYSKYYSFLVSQLMESETYKDVLMLLSNENFRSEIEYNNKYYSDDVEELLLNQLGDDLKIISNKELGANEVYIVVIDKQSGERLLTRKFSIV